MQVFTLIRDDKIQGVCRTTSLEEAKRSHDASYSFLEGEYHPSSYWLRDGVPEPLSSFDLSLSCTSLYAGDTLYLTGVPVEASVATLDLPFERLADGRIAFDTSGKNGSFILRVSCEGYKDANCSVFITSIDALAKQVRSKRDALLAASDWTQSIDAASRCNQLAWAEYRQLLCDITKQECFPLNVVWPVAPA